MPPSASFARRVVMGLHRAGSFRLSLRARLCAAGALLVLYFSAMALSAWYLHLTNRYLIRQHRPVTLEQIIPKVSDADNAALEYIRASTLASPDASRPFSLTSANDIAPLYEDLITSTAPSKAGADPYKWSPSQLQSAWSCLTSPDFMNIRTELAAASIKSTCAFDLDWDQGSAIHLPMVIPLRFFVDLLCLRALLCQIHGDDEGMREDFTSAMAISEHFSQIPEGICGYMHMATRTKVLASMSRAMHHRSLGDLTLLEHALGAHDDRKRLAQCLDFDRLSGDLDFSKTNYFPFPVNVALFPLKLFDQATFDRLFGDASSTLEKGHRIGTPDVPSIALISHFHQFGLVQLERDQRKSEQMQAIAAIALALEHWKRRNGSYPASLFKLSPDFTPETALTLAQPMHWTLSPTSWKLTADPQPAPTPDKPSSPALNWRSPP